MVATKIPREEIEYEEIYKELDLNKQYKCCFLEKSIDNSKINEINDINDGIEEMKRVKLSKDNEKVFDGKEGIKFIEFEDKDAIGRYVDSIHNFQDVHYCIDNFDKNFLTKTFKTLNQEVIELFEIIYDRLEKEWFFILQDKIKDIKKIEPNNLCDICTSQRKEDNPIFVCQGCGLNVHRDCYGTSFSEDEFFICVSCLYHYRISTCVFCKQENGFCKLTNDFKFGHLICVFFNDSLDFDNPNSKEPIDTSKYTELDGVCKFCNKDSGIISCSYGFCMQRYHVPCGLTKCYFDIANNISYCEAHDPRKNNNLLVSISVSKKLHAGYKKLSNISFIRKNLPLQKKITTEYMKIISEVPQIPKDVYERIFQIDMKEFLSCRKDFVDVNFCKDNLVCFNSLNIADFYGLVTSYWILKRKKENKSSIGFLEVNYDKLIVPNWVVARNRYFDPLF